MVVVGVGVGIVGAVERHGLIGIGEPASLLPGPTRLHEHVALIGRGGVMMLASEGVVEAIDLDAPNGSRPADALVIPARGDDAIALDGRGCVEMLARVGIIEAVHGLGLIVRCLSDKRRVGVRLSHGRGERHRGHHGERQRCAEEDRQCLSHVVLPFASVRRFLDSASLRSK